MQQQQRQQQSLCVEKKEDKSDDLWYRDVWDETWTHKDIHRQFLGCIAKR